MSPPGTAAPLVLIDAATGDDRVLATSDVQFGLPVGSPDGSRVAAVEAPCSDRQLVSGRAVVVDVPSGERRAIEMEDADITWLGWRADGALSYAALRRGRHGVRGHRSRLRRPDRDLVDERGRGRLGSVRGTPRRRRVRLRPAGLRSADRGGGRGGRGGPDGRVVPPRGPRSRPRPGRPSGTGHVERPRRPRDRRLPADAAGRRTAPVDPPRARRAGVVVSWSRSRVRPSPGWSPAATRSSCRTPGGRRGADARSSKR